jgi:UDP-glucose 4-epimerase
VLVTGANGFVGQALCAALAAAGHDVRRAVRRTAAAGAGEVITIGDIGPATDWRTALAGVDAVVHLAARVHVARSDRAIEPYMRANALGTQRLASEAARCGVRRLVYLSSVKVNGEKTTGRPYSADDDPQPLDAYGVSKWRGEQHLAEVAERSSLAAVIVRSPLIYGPGARANFLRLLEVVDRGWPLPFGAIDNRRSLINLWNITDLLVNVLTNEAAAGGTWMASDGEDLSTPELVRRIAAALGKRIVLVKAPVPLLRACAAAIGARAEIGRLCDSLTVDGATTQSTLGWAPPVSMRIALERTVAWYRTRHQGASHA